MKAFRIKRHSYEQKDDIRLSSFIALYFFFQSLNLFIKLQGFSIPGWTWIPKVCLAVVLLFCIPSLWNRAKWMSIFAELVLMILFGFSFLLGNNATVDLLSITVDEITIFLPLGLCAYAVDNYETMLNVLHRWAIVTHLVLFALFLSVTSQKYLGYTMSVGYAILLQALIMADRAFNRKSIIDISFVIIDTIMIVFLGSRGPLLCLAVYIVIKLFGIASSQRGKVLLLLLGGAFAIGLYFLFPKLITGLSNLSKTLFGIQSRTLRLFVSGNITYDAGRDWYYTYTRDRIAERPLFGWGLGGGWSNGTYPHNILYEIILSFGYLLGIPILIWILKQTIFGLFCKDATTRRIILIFFAFSISLLFSGSFIMSSSFYILLLLCCKYSRKQNGILLQFGNESCVNCTQS